MNPVITVQPATGYVHYELTEEDKERLDKITLIEGDGSGKQITANRMCVMQAVTLVTGAPSEGDERDDEGNLYEIGYAPVCASTQLASFMVQWNDDGTDEESRQKLLDFIKEGVLLNTRPVIRTTHEVGGKIIIIDKATTNQEYKNAEKRRDTILRKIDLSTDSFDSIAEAVRRACDEYKVPATEVEGLTINGTTQTEETTNGEKGITEGS